MKRCLTNALAAALLVLPCASCYTMTHTVGSGAQTGVESSQRVWYALWGLVPITKADGGEMAGGAADYTIETEHSLIDVLIGLATAWVTIYPKTVTVTK